MKPTLNSMLVAAALLMAGQQARGQDLNAAWRTIEEHFKNSRHDSVLVLVQPFIAELQRRGLTAPLSVAYYHYAVSLAHLGSYGASDSLFALAKQSAAATGDTARVSDIESKQIQVYALLAKAKEASAPREAVTLATKALRLITAAGDQQARGRLLHLRGLLYAGIGETERSLEDLEEALTALGTAPEAKPIVERIVPYLAEQYLKLDRLDQAGHMIARCTVPSVRLELTIGLASRREREGRLAEADSLLAAIQDELFKGGNERRIVEFGRKRFQLSEAQGRAGSRDMLRRMIDQLRSAGTSVGGIIPLQHLLALASVREGDVVEAEEIVRQMKAFPAANLTEEQRMLVQRTEADVAYLRGDNELAVQLYRNVRATQRSLSDPQTTAVLNNLGLALTRTGRLEEALGAFEEAARLARAAGREEEAVQADVSVGIVLLRADRTGEAVTRLTQARTVALARQDPQLVIMSSLRLAEAYRRSGQENLASGLMEEIRAEQGKLADPLSRIQVLLALATSNRTVAGGYQALADLQTAYGLARRVGAQGYLGSLAQALADAYFVLDSLTTAEEHYRSALEMYGSQTDPRAVAEIRYKLGQCLLSQKRFDDARNQVRTALRSLERTPVADPAAATPEQVVETDLYAQGLAHLAYINSAQASSTSQIRIMLQALREVQHAVALLEARQLAQLSRAQRDAASVRNVNAYRLLVDIAVALYESTQDVKYYELAFNTSEKSRAESFVAEIGSQLVTKLNDPEARRLAKVTSPVLQGMASAGPLAVGEVAGGEGTTRGTSLERERAARALENSRTEYERLLQALSSKDQKLVQLVSVNTLTLNSLRTLLEADERLVAYYVSLDRCYVFVVGSGLQQLHVVHWRPEDLGATVEGYRMALQDVRRTDHWVTGQILYDSLVAPLKRWTEGKRLIIVPSGRLNTLPFGALSSNRRYLLEECDLSVIPNVSTLQFVRTPKRVSSRSSVLAVGNPHNPHVSRLPGAEQEVMAIRSVFEGASVFVGDAASESKVREAMGSYDVVHVACHGLFNYEYPILSSLALTPDAENDGFLQVHELYNLNLLRTSLVVLSACETGLSQIKKNDDMIGFIRGFFYAGVPSTVASLWKVDDRATSSLMSNFHLLLKLGNSKSQALRKSQMQLMRAESTSHPFYWAAFVLYGNPE